jgi:hypothetical protein
VEKALQIVKKNLLSIICGVVALLAMIALAYPLSGMYTHFQADLTTRSQDYLRAQNLINTQRSLPIVRAGGTAVPLDAFPTEQDCDVAAQAGAAVKSQSDELMQKAAALNQAGHDPLLSPDILPDPRDRAFEYRTAYLDMVQKQLPQQMGGVMPPNTDEIKAATDALHQSEVEDKIIRVNGVEANRDQLEHNFQDLAAKLPDQLLEERATKYKLYMDQTSLSVHPTMLDQNKKPTPADVWYAQLALWVEQDVAASIMEANNNVPNSNVLTDAVKRLVRLDVPEGPAIYFQNGTPGAAGAAAAPVDPSTPDYSSSPTGHVCNAVYDVVQFQLVMEVDQRQIPLILHALQDNKLTNVLSVDITQVDTNAAADQGYIYGSAPIVSISLNCETLFMRSWTTKLMPDEVKNNDLHIPPPAAPGA